MLNRAGERAEFCAPAACALAGAWLLAGPPALGYRGEAAAVNDAVCGVAAVAVAAWWLVGRGVWARWLLCLLGVWLLHAPLVFWAGSAAAYLNATVGGIGLIVFSVVLPRGIWGGSTDPREVSRGSVEISSGASDIPPGWSFNPSSWAQRTPIIALAWINFFLARYLAAYQLGHIDHPWDPLFGDGTRRVLDSDVSEAFPVSDAGLGAAAYVIEALIGYMGTAGRWRTAPWTVALFGVLVVPVGVVSTVLMILQPVAVGAWCTVCLIAAGLMIVMACLALPEVVAMVQFMARQRGEGAGRLWRVFWLGEHAGPQASSPEPRAFLREMVRGTTMPWTLVLSAGIGVWLVAAPAVLAVEGAAVDAHVVAGALAIVVSVMAMSEVARVVRLANMLVGAGVGVMVWPLEGAPLGAQLAGVGAGLALIGLSPWRGAVRDTCGSWDRFIR